MAVAIPPRPQRRPLPLGNGLLDSEARRIARTVCSYGVLERTRIYELTEASRWRASSFDRACELAVRRGLVRDLGLGYYAPPTRPRQAADPTSARKTTTEDDNCSLALLIVGALVVLAIVLLVALAAQGETFGLIVAVALTGGGLLASYLLVNMLDKRR